MRYVGPDIVPSPPKLPDSPMPPTLLSGSACEVIDEHDGYVKIRLGNGTQFNVPAETVER